MPKPYKAAAVQAAPAFLDLPRSIGKCVRLIEEAADGGASLVAFPETFVPGYPWFIWLDSPAWAMQFIPRYHENSLVLGSAEAQRLADAARRRRIHVAVGHSERDGGSLYIGQWLIGPDGGTVAVRRKLKPTHVERTVFGEGDGSDLAVHKTALGNMGALCCWEHLQPLSKYAMYAQNEQVHVAAWPSFSLYPGMAHALGAEVNVAASRIYAVEGGGGALAPCATVSPEMAALLCGDDAKRALLQPGGGHARIIGPDGRDLAAPLAEDAEGLLYAEIDLGAIPLAKAAADPAGHYARPDVTRLLLDRRPRRPVVAAGHEMAEAAPVLAPVLAPDASPLDAY